MDKTDVAHGARAYTHTHHSEILFSLNKEGNPAICNIMDGP